MWLLDKLFGRKTDKKPVDLSEHREYLDSLREPMIWMEADQTPGLSKIGGLPVAPASLEWPAWQDRPLSFLCQIDLAAVPRTEITADLPPSGMLYFFYNQEPSTWGFDPADRGSWRVVYVESKENLSERQKPEGVAEECVYAEKFIRFSSILTYPDCEDERVAKLGLSSGQISAYDTLRESVFAGQPVHQLLGRPLPIQGDEMDLECQLASNGIYVGNPTGYASAKAREYWAGRTDWLLLLQLDSDDAANMMWGDVGRLYFWIRKEDLRNGKFDNVWMILQCY